MKSSIEYMKLLICVVFNVVINFLIWFADCLRLPKRRLRLTTKYEYRTKLSLFYLIF